MNAFLETLGAGQDEKSVRMSFLLRDDNRDVGFQEYATMSLQALQTNDEEADNGEPNDEEADNGETNDGETNNDETNDGETNNGETNDGETNNDEADNGVPDNDAADDENNSDGAADDASEEIIFCPDTSYCPFLSVYAGSDYQAYA